MKGILLSKVYKEDGVSIEKVCWTSSGKNNKKKSFSIRKWGYVGAYRLAKQYLIDQYTEICMEENPPVEPPVWLRSWLIINQIPFKLNFTDKYSDLPDDEEEQ